MSRTHRAKGKPWNCWGKAGRGRWYKSTLSRRRHTRAQLRGDNPRSRGLAFFESAVNHRGI